MTGGNSCTRLLINDIDPSSTIVATYVNSSATDVYTHVPRSEQCRWRVLTYNVRLFTASITDVRRRDSETSDERVGCVTRRFPPPLYAPKPTMVATTEMPRRLPEICSDIIYITMPVANRRSRCVHY